MNNLTVGQISPETTAPVPANVFQAPDALTTAVNRMRVEEEARNRAYTAPASAISTQPMLTAMANARIAAVQRAMPGVTAPRVSMPTDPVRDVVDKAVAVIASTGDVATMKRYSEYFNTKLGRAMAARPTIAALTATARRRMI